MFPFSYHSFQTDPQTDIFESVENSWNLKILNFLAKVPEFWPNSDRTLIWIVRMVRSLADRTFQLSGRHGDHHGADDEAHEDVQRPPEKPSGPLRVLAALDLLCGGLCFLNVILTCSSNCSVIFGKHFEARSRLYQNQNQKSFGFRKERKPRCVRETKSSPNPSRQVLCRSI